jgi:putative endonuclease
MASNATSGDAWWLYVLECRDGTYYCGTSNDVPRRLRAHNGLLAGGAKYTRPRRPVRLVASWAYPDKATAMAAEVRFKRLDRAQKASFVEYPQHWT